MCGRFVEIKLMMAGFCPIEVDTSTGIGCEIWGKDCLLQFHGSEMFPR